MASAQDKKDEISSNLVPNPAVINCLRANSYDEPRARATVIRGKLNDTLILDLDGIKPELAFDLFTVQHSPFLADGSKDPAFTGSFGLAWYQSDIESASTPMTDTSESRQFSWIRSSASMPMYS